MPSGAPWWTLLPQRDSQQLGQGEAVAAVAGKYGGQDEREQAWGSEDGNGWIDKLPENLLQLTKSKKLQGTLRD